MGTASLYKTGWGCSWKSISPLLEIWSDLGNDLGQEHFSTFLYKAFVVNYRASYPYEILN